MIKVKISTVRHYLGFVPLPPNEEGIPPINGLPIPYYTATTPPKSSVAIWPALLHIISILICIGCVDLNAMCCVSACYHPCAVFRIEQHQADFLF